MYKVEFFIQTNLRDKQTVLQVAGDAVAKYITSLLMDIKDPVTGESPTMTCDKHPKGFMLALHGSASVRAEAEIRIHAMTLS